jgi:hypothetical protein
VASPEPRVNNLLRGLGPSFISHEPCRYDCSASLALANALARSLQGRDPDTAAVVDRILAQTVAVHRSGRRCVLRLDGSRVVAAEAVSPQLGLEASDEERRLAASLVGRDLRCDDTIRHFGRGRVMVIDFARRRAGAASCR